MYNEDIRIHGPSQAMKWVKQGKYNLNSKELDTTHLQYERKDLQSQIFRNRYNCGKEKARIAEIDRILEMRNWDYKNTAAALQWQKAHDAEMQYYK